MLTTKLGEVILDTIMRIYSNRKVSVGEKDKKEDFVFNYLCENMRYHVVVERGVNYKLQQQATIESLMDLAKSSPPFAQFLYSAGIPIILANIDIKDKSKFISAFEQFKEEQEQKQEEQMKMMGGNQQMATQVAKQKVINESQSAKAKMMDVANRTQEIALKKEGMAHDQVSMHLNDLMRILEIATENKKTEAQTNKVTAENMLKLADINVKHKSNLMHHLKG
jgi:hypothetical protein